mgnify:FL=1
MPCVNFPAALAPELYRTGVNSTEPEEEEEEYSDDSLAEDESPTKTARVTARLAELAAGWNDDSGGGGTLVELDSLFVDTEPATEPQPSLVLDSLEPVASEPLRLMNELRILQEEMKQLTTTLQEDTSPDIAGSVLTPVPEIDELPTPVAACLPSPRSKLPVRYSPTSPRPLPASTPSPPLGARSMWIPATEPSTLAPPPVLRSSISSARLSLKSSRASSPRFESSSQQARS